ncbi:hypothetical protein B0T10DRAFT_568283 [Thelonectria olida]|uniref:Uncharacterized protein n=1 Tax=Thelonectria olida TaxID=1576542 RepID=A0A9P8VTA4_9HYPO|nr:hypothetical protein B0T10DRAFT_568283 [Thelonectria olida]
MRVPTITASARPSPRQDLPSTAHKINLQDLELFHVYSTTTYATLSLSTTLRNFWRIAVLGLALNNEYLLDLLLLPTLRYRSIANKWSATLTTLKRCSFGDVPVKEGSFEDWIFLIQGTRQLRDTLGWDASESSLAPLFKFGAERWDLQCPSTSAGVYGSDTVCEIQDRINAQVEDLESIYIYTETINSLRSAVYYSVGLEGTDVFVWLHRCIDGFLPLLERSTQKAQAILEHFCVMVKKAETQWWLQGWANRIMSEVYGRMDEEHRAWICRPAEEIGWVAPSG